jgi:UDP-N-acetylmuramate dehydrogenase
VILEVELELKLGDKEKIKETIKNNLAQRKDRIPPYPSIGCIFKNQKPLSAGKLIEDCGLKGQRVGDAQVSQMQANFIVNLGNATAKDVLKLMEICRQKVKEKFGVDLENEIVII